MQVNKRGLCAYDDKRYLLEDGISTLAFGHKAIPANVRAIQETRGLEQVLTAAEARGHSMPHKQQPHLFVGQDPVVLVAEARRVAMLTQAARGPVYDMDPDGPNPLSFDDLITFVLDDA